MIFYHRSFCGTLNTPKGFMRGRFISEDLRWVIINMAKRLSIDSIVNLTGGTISKRTIEGILSKYRKTGMVAVHATSHPLRSNRVLTMDGTLVRRKCVYFRAED